MVLLEAGQAQRAQASTLTGFGGSELPERRPARSVRSTH